MVPKIKNPSTIGDIHSRSSSEALLRCLAAIWSLSLTVAERSYLLKSCSPMVVVMGLLIIFPIIMSFLKSRCAVAVVMGLLTMTVHLLIHKKTLS